MRNPFQHSHKKIFFTHHQERISLDIEKRWKLFGKTALGRYLDSESDLVVNAALFVALGTQIGPWAALAGFATLTLVLSVNFNVERLYRRERGEPASAMPEADGAAAMLARVYGAVYAPQDRLVEAVEVNPRKGFLLRSPFPVFTTEPVGRRIQHVWRRGKHLIFDLEGDGDCGRHLRLH